MMSDQRKMFLEAYDLYAEPIYRHCYFRVFSKEYAEELMQETFLKTWQYLDSGKSVENMKPFLWRVATNLIIDQRRKKREESLENLLEKNIIPEPSGAENEGVETKFLLGEAMKAFDRLRDEERNLLIMRYVDDMDPKEIADVLHTTSNNVSVKLHHAVKKLREII